MADRFTSGGFMYDPDSGRRIDEATALVLDARQRETEEGAAAAAKAEADRAVAGRWDRDKALDGTTPAEDLPSGLYPVLSNTTAKNLGLPTSTTGSLWVHRVSSTLGRMEWRPTSSTDVWHRRLSGSTWTAWEPFGVSRVPLLPENDVKSLPTGIYQVNSGSTARSLGLPEASSGSLWVHRLTADTGRMEWRPTSTLNTWTAQLHGATGWSAWTLTGRSVPEDDPADTAFRASSPTPAGTWALAGTSLALETAPHTLIPRSVGVDGLLYGYTSNRAALARSGDGLATAPQTTVPVSTWVPAELQGKGVSHVEATTTGYLFIYETAHLQNSVWFSESWEGPYRKVLDLGPWHVTAWAKPRVIDGTSWLLLGEYTNATIPSPTRRRWLSTDGGKSWRVVRTTAPVTDQVNNHCHTGMIDSTGRLFVSDGDGPNNDFVYSDDLGATWTRIPTSEAIRNGYVNTHQPTLLIDFGDRIISSPDAGPYAPGLWEIDPGTLEQDYKWAAPGGPYVDASKRYGRSIFAQDGDTAFVLFPPGNRDVATAEPVTYVAGTPDGGRTWGVVATIDATGGTLEDGIIGPDRHGYVYMRGWALPTYGASTIRARVPWV